MSERSHTVSYPGIYADAVFLRSAMDRGDVTAREALEACISIIDARNGEINAIVHQDRDGASADADACDQSDVLFGPLHGIPVTVKESFDWAGHPTTWGDPARADQIAGADADVVARLKRAGAVILGKTNIPAYLSDWETVNPLFGATRNPADPTRSAGGSSGGSAAAVASGMSYIDIGSDQGGSIRYPAHNCGVHGLKPSWGVISLRGHSPLGELRRPDIAAAGPLARSARDVALALAVLSDGFGRQTTQPLEKVRFAQLPTQTGCPIDNEYQAAIVAFAERLKQAGAQVDLVQPDIDFERATELMNLLVRAETSRKSELISIFRTQQGIGSKDANSFTQINARGTALSHKEWLTLHEERLLLCQQVGEFFEDYDILICPAAASPAPPLRLYADAASRTVPVNGQEEPILQQHMLHMLGSLLYLPAHVMPCGSCSDGLSLGIQMIAAFGHDQKILAVAELINQSVMV